MDYGPEEYRNPKQIGWRIPNESLWRFQWTLIQTVPLSSMFRYMTEHGLQLEHFLFAKWGWSDPQTYFLAPFSGAALVHLTN